MHYNGSYLCDYLLCPQKKQKKKRNCPKCVCVIVCDCCVVELPKISPLIKPTFMPCHVDDAAAHCESPALGQK